MNNYNVMKITGKNINNKNGISLIILIMVICVMLIISSSIIISIYNSNPIEEGQNAKYEYDRDSMQAAFTDVVSKIMALNGSTLIIEPTELNNVKSGEKETTGEVEYKLKYTQYSKNAKGKIIFDNQKNTNTDFYTGIKLPIYKEETTWYVDSSGNISLKVGDKTFSNSTETFADKLIKSIVTQRKDTSIDIEVKKNDTAQIISYIYYIRALGEQTWRDFNSTENTITIDGLDKDLDYEIKVKAKSGDKEEESNIEKVNHLTSSETENTDKAETTE